jgi:hypothetical protein
VEIISPLGFSWKSSKSRPNSKRIFLMSVIRAGLEIFTQFEYIRREIGMFYRRWQV